MKTIILAGGSGTRLWPLSRRTFPKQFLKLNGNKSLLQKTVERFLKISDSEDIIIMTNKDYKFLVLAELKSSGFNIPEKNIVLEPHIRNCSCYCTGYEVCFGKIRGKSRRCSFCVTFRPYYKTRR